MGCCCHLVDRARDAAKPRTGRFAHNKPEQKNISSDQVEKPWATPKTVDQISPQNHLTLRMQLLVWRRMGVPAPHLALVQQLPGRTTQPQEGRRIQVLSAAAKLPAAGSAESVLREVAGMETRRGVGSSGSLAIGSRCPVITRHHRLAPCVAATQRFHLRVLGSEEEGPGRRLAVRTEPACALVRGAEPKRASNARAS